MKILIPILFCINIFSQENVIIYPPQNISTVIFKGSSDLSNIPSVPLGTNIKLEFDDLDTDIKDYYYTIEHFNPFWEISDLIYTDFLKGYQENKILTFYPSFNTTINYTHYELSIPNQDLSIKISGNYLLKIFHKNNIVFTRPFIVYENLVSIYGEVKRLLNFDNHKQQLIFNINTKKYKIDEYNNLEIIALQNGNFRNKIINIKPKFISKDNIKFNENDKIIFNGNNEFRNIDLKDDMGNAMGINHIEKDDILNFYLNGIESKRTEPYTIRYDINGNFVVRSLRASNQSTEADYALVHFRYYSEFLDPKIKLYVFGGFNFWKLDEDNQMSYNFDKSRYECSLLLKQGFYDYTIISKDKNNTDYDFLDGSSYLTDNNYQIIVYYKDIFDRHYRVIGFYNLNSQTIRQ